VDDALATGQINPTLPFVRREAVAALKAQYASQDDAASRIARRITDFYQGQLPQVAAERKADVAKVVAVVQGLYRRNIFPEMKVIWGIYPNNLGHVSSPGCFRCHDDVHTAKDGQVIRQDCELCHKMG